MSPDHEIKWPGKIPVTKTCFALPYGFNRMVNVSRPFNFTIWLLSLASMFPGLDSPILLPVRNLTPEVYATQPHSTQDLKDHIMEGIGTISAALLQ
jgi:hypothetical protein